MSDGNATALHPYYPLGVVIPGYVAPSLSTLEILTKFTLTCLSILIPTWVFVYSRKRPISRQDTVATLWFVLCGFIHLGLEGTFKFFPCSPHPRSRCLKDNIQGISHSTTMTSQACRPLWPKHGRNTPCPIRGTSPQTSLWCAWRP